MATMKKSFEQWCLENNRQCYLDMWDYNLNLDKPSEIPQTSHKKRWFKCNNPEHPSFQRIIEGLRVSKLQICPYCNSFYDWCINNNHPEYIEAWDYKKNIDDIHTISWSSSKKQWFNVGMYSYQYDTAHITGSTPNNDPFSRYYNSFGYWLISNFGSDAINTYWSDKNEKSPFDFPKGSTYKVWFKCTEKEYHPDYEMSMELFYRGCRCVYCASKIIHPKDSLGAYMENKMVGWYDKCWAEDNDVDPFEISPFSRTKIHIQCPNVSYHDFWVIAQYYYHNSIENGTCPFCSGHRTHPLDSLGTKHPEVIDLWSDKNEKTPYEYSPYSNQIVWWKCNNGVHEDYQRSINGANSKMNFYCPMCSRLLTMSSFETSVLSYLVSLGYNVLNENDCNLLPINPKTGAELRYDNEIEELKLVIEVHGQQHYEANSYHNRSADHKGISVQEEFEYGQWKDLFKKEYALQHGYNYLEIPYWTVDDGSFKSLIDDEISKIKNQKSVSTTGGIRQLIS